MINEEITYTYNVNYDNHILFDFKRLKSLEPDVPSLLSLLGGNVTFHVDKSFDIPRGEDFNIVTGVKQPQLDGHVEKITIRIHKCRVCSISFRDKYEISQVVNCTS